MRSIQLNEKTTPTFIVNNQSTMSFEKLERLLPYPVHCIEEKIVMKPKEAIALGEYEQELCDKEKQKKLKQTGME